MIVTRTIHVQCTLLHSCGIPKQSGGLIEVITSLDKNSSIGPRPFNEVWFAVIKEIGF